MRSLLKRTVDRYSDNHFEQILTDGGDYVAAIYCERDGAEQDN